MTTDTSETPPTLDEWRLLYDVALKVKELAPWTWMWDSDDFAVKDPETGTIGYCVVLGRLGECFGVGVYLGMQGLAGLLELRGRKSVPDFMEFLQAQLLLRASFEGRSDLEPDDLKVIKELGLKFRGQAAWPQFRSFRPGYMPWFLTGSEARFLAVALGQTIDVALRFKENPKLLERPREDIFPVRVPQQDAAGLLWHDEWLAPEPFVNVAELTRLNASRRVDPVLLARARNAVKERGGTWEIDIFPIPATIREPGERPFFPLTFQILDHETGLAFGIHVAPPDKSVEEFRDHFTKTIEDSRTAPQAILVANARTLTLLEPICTELGIALNLVKKLPQMREYRRKMEKFLRKAPQDPFSSA